MNSLQGRRELVGCVGGGEGDNGFGEVDLPGNFGGGVCGVGRGDDDAKGE